MGVSVAIVDVVQLVTALAAGLVAGVFFAFSTFVMPALARLPPAQGVAAMQAINVAAINRWFLGVLLGGAVGCGGLLGAAALAWHEPGAGLRTLGAAAYLLGTLGVTIACNVPRNDALATLAADSGEALALWPVYVREWTAWNHVRALAAAIAAAALVIALARG